VSVKRTYPTPDRGLTHLFYGHGRSLVFVWSRINAPVELILINVVINNHIFVCLFLSEKCLLRRGTK